jgi:hypothetical protein
MPDPQTAADVLSRLPDQQEVDLLCLLHHERVTGKVNQHRLVIVATKTFTTRQGTFADAREKVEFKEAA